MIWEVDRIKMLLRLRMGNRGPLLLLTYFLPKNIVTYISANSMCLTCISHLTITKISLSCAHTQYQKAPRIHQGFYIPQIASGYGTRRLDRRKGPRARIALFLVR